MVGGEPEEISDCGGDRKPRMNTDGKLKCRTRRGYRGDLRFSILDLRLRREQDGIGPMGRIGRIEE